jgi:hypothetical protein
MPTQGRNRCQKTFSGFLCSTMNNCSKGSRCYLLGANCAIFGEDISNRWALLQEHLQQVGTVTRTSPTGGHCYNNISYRWALLQEKTLKMNVQKYTLLIKSRCVGYQLTINWNLSCIRTIKRHFFYQCLCANPYIYPHNQCRTQFWMNLVSWREVCHTSLTALQLLSLHCQKFSQFWTDLV